MKEVLNSSLLKGLSNCIPFLIQANEVLFYISHTHLQWILLVVILVSLEIKRWHLNCKSLGRGSFCFL